MKSIICTVALILTSLFACKQRSTEKFRLKEEGIYSLDKFKSVKEIAAELKKSQKEGDVKEIEEALTRNIPAAIDMYCIQEDEVSKKRSVALYGVGFIVADDRDKKVVTALTAAHVIETGAHSLENKKFESGCLIGVHRIRQGKIEQYRYLVDDFTVVKSEFSQDEKADYAVVRFKIDFRPDRVAELSDGAKEGESLIAIGAPHAVVRSGTETDDFRKERISKFDQGCKDLAKKFNEQKKTDRTWSDAISLRTCELVRKSINEKAHVTYSYKEDEDLFFKLFFSIGSILEIYEKDYLITNVDIIPGFSGGPLISVKTGKVVGMGTRIPLGIQQWILKPGEAYTVDPDTGKPVGKPTFSLPTELFQGGIGPMMTEDFQKELGI